MRSLRLCERRRECILESVGVVDIDLISTGIRSRRPCGGSSVSYSPGFRQSGCGQAAIETERYMTCNKDCFIVGASCGVTHVPGLNTVESLLVLNICMEMFQDLPVLFSTMPFQSATRCMQCPGTRICVDNDMLRVGAG